MKTSTTAFFVAAFVGLSTVAALAAPATTRRSAPLFDGPSTRFEVITVLPADTDVEVDGCSRGWCYVWIDDDEGFIRESLLAFYDEAAPIVVFPPALYQYGWRYWRQRNPGEWGRWHDRYRRDTRPPPRRDDRPRAPQVAPPSAPRGAPSQAPGGAPSSAPRGAPSQAPGGAPSQAPRGGQSPGSRGGPPSPDSRDAPPPPTPPGAPPMPPR